MRRILRRPEAGSYIGLSPRTLDRLRESGEGPAYVRLGRRAVGYDVRDLDRWIDEQRSRGLEPNR